MDGVTAAWLAAVLTMNGLALEQLVWCWPVYVVTDGSCFNLYEVVGASYVVVGLADAMDDAMVLSVRLWETTTMVFCMIGRHYVERGCGNI